MKATFLQSENMIYNIQGSSSMKTLGLDRNTENANPILIYKQVISIKLYIFFSFYNIQLV